MAKAVVLGLLLFGVSVNVIFTLVDRGSGQEVREINLLSQDLKTEINEVLEPSLAEFETTFYGLSTSIHVSMKS